MSRFTRRWACSARGCKRWACRWPGRGCYRAGGRQDGYESAVHRSGGRSCSRGRWGLRVYGGRGLCCRRRGHSRCDVGRWLCRIDVGREPVVGWLRPLHGQSRQSVPLVRTVDASDAQQSRAVLGHVAGFLLPLVGPLVLLIASRNEGRFVRRHLAVSAVVSSLWLVLAIGVISIDVGSLSLDEQRTSTGGLLGLLLVAGAVLWMVLVNVRRAKRHQPPLGSLRRRSR